MRREANRAVFPWAPSRSRPCKVPHQMAGNERAFLLPLLLLLLLLLLILLFLLLLLLLLRLLLQHCCCCCCCCCCCYYYYYCYWSCRYYSSISTANTIIIPPQAPLRGSKHHGYNCSTPPPLQQSLSVAAAVKSKSSINGTAAKYQTAETDAGRHQVLVPVRLAEGCESRRSFLKLGFCMRGW